MITWMATALMLGLSASANTPPGTMKVLNPEGMFTLRVGDEHKVTHMGEKNRQVPKGEIPNIPCDLREVVVKTTGGGDGWRSCEIVRPEVLDEQRRLGNPAFFRTNTTCWRAVDLARQGCFINAHTAKGAEDLVVQKLKGYIDELDADIGALKERLITDADFRAFVREEIERAVAEEMKKRPVNK